MRASFSLAAAVHNARLWNASGLQMLRATWQYRGFVWGMVKREFQARYLNSLLGSLWAVLNPLAMILIYTVIFSRVIGARLPGVNDTWAYGAYLCAGLLPWTCFTELVLRSQTTFIENANLLKKMSFPRITLPVILLLSTTVNFAIMFGIFVAVLLAIGRMPGAALVAFVPLFVLQQLFALGAGIFLGTLNVFFRDIAQLVGVAFQFWFWFTPIVYSIAALPERLQAWFRLNPMTAFVGAYQQIVLNARWPDWTAFLPHLAGTLAILALALFTFLKLSGEMIDEI
jgi:lipopolysaccharide transport system permease protein